MLELAGYYDEQLVLRPVEDELELEKRLKDVDVIIEKLEQKKNIGEREDW